MPDSEDRSLIPIPDLSLSNTAAGAQRILSVMTEETCALVREGKRLYLSNGQGMTEENIRAFGLFLRAAEAGHSEGQYNLGCCYWHGRGVPQDHVAAAKWYRKAAEQGDAPGQNTLGCCYRDGQGVPQDYVEAVKWYRKAAEQGHAAGQTNLGFCYGDGQGVPQDYNEEFNWYRKAAEQGDATGQNNLGYCYKNGEGVPKDDVEAVKWYRKSAEQGNATGQIHLGCCCQDGQGVPQDYVEAVKWYRKAAEQGDASGQNFLGLCYDIGQGVPKDHGDAVKWYRKAAEQGNPAAQSNLASCYYDGIGVRQDTAEALTWYRKAAEQGHATAQKWLSDSNPKPPYAHTVAIPLTLERATKIVEHAEMEFGAGEHIEDAFMPFFRGGASTRLEALQALYIVIAEFYHHAFIRNPGNEEKRRIFEGYARSSGGIGMRIMCDHIRDPEKLKHAFVGVTNETVASFVAFLRTTRPKMADFWPQVYHHLDLDYPGETESEPMIEKPWWRFW